MGLDVKSLTFVKAAEPVEAVIPMVCFLVRFDVYRSGGKIKMRIQSAVFWYEVQLMDRGRR